MQVDPNTVSSDGFMFNITTCLDQLCEPFMDASFTKVMIASCSCDFQLLIRVDRSDRCELSPPQSSGPDAR